MLAFDKILQDIIQFRFNPAGIQRAVLRGLNEINDGQDIYFDPTNPFIQALSASAVETAAFMQEHAAESRRRYPVLAQSQEDLYLHMSDEDYINRFAVPATATFNLFFLKSELLNKMTVEPETGYKKLTIPRNTFFSVADTVFSLQYPIDIRQLAHGGLQITYNNDIASPLQVLESNSIPYEIMDHINGEYVKFDVLATQFFISQIVEPISKAKDLRIAMPIADQFYFARVYHKNTTTGKWDELTTTHAEGVYDNRTPTAVLHVADGFLQVKIPQIYINNGQLTSSIRVDMYQTKGAINLLLGDYAAGLAFSITWKTFDSTEVKNVFSTSLTSMNVVVASQDTVIAGSNEMPFETLRKNVINNATGPIRQATTPAQLETQLKNAGYDIVKNIDNITDRIYLATREMPSPDLVTGTTPPSTGNKLLTAAAASIETLTVSLEALAQLPTVKDNGASITITPDTLYQIVDGITQPVTATQVQHLLSLPPDKCAQEVTRGSYLYTPFHYVLDASAGTFEIRPYYLDDPVAASKVFIRQNDTTLMSVGTSKYALVRGENGFVLQIQTRSDETFKGLVDGQVFVQLAYIPAGERDRAYLNGVLVGKTDTGERIYNFDLSTTFNIDSANNLELSKFTMYNTEPRITRTLLESTFDIIYSTSATLTSRWRPNEIDQVLGRHLLPNQAAGINHEQVKLKFGSALEMLWTRSRTVASSITYQAWESDQQAFYKEDVYQYNANGTKLSIVDGVVVYTKLHLKGDPILDIEGAITYEHRKGDLKRDSSGELIPVNQRALIRQMELMLLEGVYWFATDPTTSNYRIALTKALVSWVTGDLNQFKSSLLDKTRIYFYPKTTSGIVSVFVYDDQRKAIAAGQAFSVTLAVSKQVFDNLNLRERLTISTIAVLSEQLKGKTVSVSQMVSALSDAYGSDVIDTQLTGLGGENNYPVISIAEETDRLSVRKRLVALADGKLACEEDISCTFIVHNAS